MIDENRIPGFVRHFQPSLAGELEEVTEEAFDKMIANWEKGADATGRAWEPLAPTTRSAGGILIDSGDMIDSADYKVSKKNLTAQVYIDDEKAVYHEQGTERMPRRPILAPTLKVIDGEMNESVGDSVDTAMKRAATGALVGRVLAGIGGRR